MSEFRQILALCTDCMMPIQGVGNKTLEPRLSNETTPTPLRPLQSEWRAFQKRKLCCRTIAYTYAENLFTALCLFLHRDSCRYDVNRAWDVPYWWRRFFFGPHPHILNILSVNLHARRDKSIKMTHKN
jgi:hypothetical protein